MPSTYSSNLRIQLMQTGLNTGQWGNITNVNLGNVIEQAVTYQSTVPVLDSTTPTDLISVDGTSVGDTARSLYIKLTGALTATRTVRTPQLKHLYIIDNSTTGGQSITFTSTAVSSVGVTIPNGAKSLVYCDGTDVLSTITYLPSIVSAAITNSTINSTTIGAITPSSGIFTSGSAGTWNITTGGTLANVSITNGTGNYTSLTITSVTVNGGAINATSIGATTPSTGAFTSLTSTSGAVNATIGATTRNSGLFTTLDSSGVYSNTVLDGTPPMAISSTTRVTNLNVARSGFSDTSTIADDTSTNSTVYPLFAGAISGQQALKGASTKWTFNPSTGAMTLSGAFSAGSLTLTTPLAATSGGTNQASYAVGDILYASTTTALSKLADIATGNVLISGGVATAPSYGKVGLTTHISGTLPVANGGTGQTSYIDGELLIGNTTGNTLTKTTLTAGSGVSITNGAGSISISATGLGGTVTSVAQSFTGGIISVGGSPVTTSGTLALTVAGTSGGIPYFSSGTAWATSAALTQYGIVYGGGAGAAPVATAAGTTGQVLTATTAGAPTWANPATSGTVTSVGWTGGIVSIATATTTPAFTVAGTSGGIPYFSSSTTWATSGVLATNAIVLGKGAGNAPATTTTGTGVVTALGVNIGSTGSFAVQGSSAVFASAATTPVVVTFYPTAMTVNCALSNVFTTTFTANVTAAPAFSNLVDGQTINWFITQDGTGNHTMTWPTSFKWPGGTVGVLSIAANAVDLLIATYRSSTGFWYATISKGFS